MEPGRVICARTMLAAAAAALFLYSPLAAADSRQLSRHEKCLLGLFYKDQALNDGKVVNGFPAMVAHDPVMTGIVHIALKRKYGVTIGSEMFFPSGELDTRTKSGMVWLAHEMKHVAQAGVFGPPQDFLQAYSSTIRDGLLSGDGGDAAYMSSPFETDARAVAAAFEVLMSRNGEIGSALSSGDPDEAVCGLVNDRSQEYKALLVRELGGKERETRKFTFPSYPFLLPKKVTYTFYK